MGRTLSRVVMRCTLAVCLWAWAGLACKAAASSHGTIYTTHDGDIIPVGSQVQLDVHVEDSKGMAVQWRSLVPHHSRKLHVYAVHQVCGCLHGKHEACLCKHF